MATGTLEKTTGAGADAVLAAEIRRAIRRSQEGSLAEAERIMEVACERAEATTVLAAGSGAR